MVALELKVMCDNNDSTTYIYTASCFSLKHYFFLLLSCPYSSRGAGRNSNDILMYTFDTSENSPVERKIVRLFSTCIGISDGSTNFLNSQICIVEMGSLNIVRGVHATRKEIHLHGTHHWIEGMINENRIPFDSVPWIHTDTVSFSLDLECAEMPSYTECDAYLSLC